MCAVVWQLWKIVATRNCVSGPLSEHRKLKLMQCMYNLKMTFNILYYLEILHLQYHKNYKLMLEML